jgi:hypothetical protein
VAVDRDAGVEVWILFDGEEEGGTVGEEGSTWSNVRLGIRKMDIEGKGTSSRGKQNYRDYEWAGARQG